ncbi:protease Do [Chthoniobacter flavus Ellin428]|uniref:Protease Do n=1 Tax=Chthoniobacter flavus Ellin428 TaxID=497964 RepID=B4D4R0_9BACT|nr:DegQ family serine endoprotease [Chthoniobacter flavus]EDY18513.1 protease Do [Chthoniobacter flavus Ellin428]TCO91027.1 serine protease Do [Chthoniobacter flavus]
MKSTKPLFSSIAALLLSAAIAPLALADEAPPASVKVDPNPITHAAGTLTTFAPVVEKVSPSVVTIATSKMVKRNASPNNPYLNDPMFRRFFGIPDNEDEQGGDQAPRNNRGGNNNNGKKHLERFGLGSGVIVSPEGHILTNNHVIEGADEIIVTIGNDKKEYKATKIGADPSTDIAVLKIQPDTKLHEITFADSDKLRVGDFAIAVGNPFGLTQSVTMGIVSALGRSDMHVTDYENFIQTDASINPGNSGGALVDIEGRLIGINTLIYSRSGGNMGIGFAVPSNLAHSVMDSLIKNGKVSRGFLGIALQPLSEDLAKAFKIENNAGVLVAEVTSKSPAEKAGILAGDVVVEVNGKKVEGPRELQMMVAGIAPGTTVPVKLVRDGQEKMVKVELAERPTNKVASADQPEKNTDPDVLDGVTVGDVNGETRKKFDLPESTKGVVITEIDPDSPSAEAGLKAGDVIHEINREPVTSAKQAVEMSEKVKKEKKVLLRVSTKGSSRYVVVERKD